MVGQELHGVLAVGIYLNDTAKRVFVSITVVVGEVEVDCIIAIVLVEQAALRHGSLLAVQQDGIQHLINLLFPQLVGGRRII